MKSSIGLRDWFRSVKKMDYIKVVTKVKVRKHFAVLDKITM